MRAFSERGESERRERLEERKTQGFDFCLPTSRLSSHQVSLKMPHHSGVYHLRSHGCCSDEDDERCVNIVDYPEY